MPHYLDCWGVGLFTGSLMEDCYQFLSPVCGETNVELVILAKGGVEERFIFTKEGKAALQVVQSLPSWVSPAAFRDVEADVNCITELLWTELFITYCL